MCDCISCSRSPWNHCEYHFSLWKLLQTSGSCLPMQTIDCLPPLCQVLPSNERKILLMLIIHVIWSLKIFNFSFCTSANPMIFFLYNNEIKNSIHCRLSIWSIALSDDLRILNHTVSVKCWIVFSDSTPLSAPSNYYCFLFYWIDWFLH